MRRCVACRESKPQEELMRFTLSEGHLSADIQTKADGRGYYLCRKDDCINTAIKRKAFNRACRCDLSTDEVIKVIEEAFNNN
ncbi:MAG: YlxR family protein [Mogibacterium sp.]|nr:YlxR family protein [Mogibacterium sp.]